MNLSEPGVVELDSGAALHHVLEGAHLFHVGTATRAEVAGLGRALARILLLTNARGHVVGLVLVNQLGSLVRSAGLGESPSGEVLLARGVGAGFGYITARTHGSGCRGLVLQATSTTETEGKLRSLRVLKSLAWEVLRSGSSLDCVELHLKAGYLY